jgi:hypothetical protein
MTPTKHRVVAGILFLLVLLVVIGTVRNGLAVGWDPSATITFGRRATPFGLVAIVFAVLGAVFAAAGIWQLRRASR